MKAIAFLRRVLRISLAAVFTSVIALLLMTEFAQSQWQLVQTFPSPITVPYFVPGFSGYGFVGCLDGTVYRTINGGQTFTSASINGSPYRINCFTFKDSLNGWFSCGISNNTAVGCYHTTDGGVNWSPTNQTNAKPSLFYNHTSGLLFLVGWYSPMTYSSDDGVTWSSLGYQDYNGPAFVSDNVGIVSNTFLAGSNFIATNDAGLTWHYSTLALEAWQPVAIPCTSELYALAEGSGQLYRSVDSARSWNLVASVGGAETGTIVGDKDHLFFHSATGLKVSIDRGVTWTSIGGPTTNQADTRFCYADAILYAQSSTGSLYSYRVNIGPTFDRILMSSDSVKLEGPTCTGTDSLINIATTNPCGYSSLLSVSFDDTLSFSVSSARKLPTDFGGSVPIRLHYKGSRYGVDSMQQMLHIHYSVLDQPHDTVIIVTGVATLKNAVSLGLPSWSITHSKACTNQDTIFYIRNRTCDSAWITNAKLLDTTAFRVGQIKIPFGLGPNDSVAIHLSADNPSSGLYTTSLSLQIQNRIRSMDSSIPLSLRVLASPRPVVTVPSISFENPCLSLDSSLHISNLGCDSLIVTSAQIIGTTDFTFASPQFPVNVLPGTSLPLLLSSATEHKEQLKASVRIKMHYHGLSFDTILPITLTMKSDRVLALDVSPKVPNAGFVSTCRTKNFPVYIRNPLCGEVTLDSISFGKNISSFTLLSLPKTPKHFGVGEIDTLSIHFAPTTSGNNKFPLHIYVTLNGKQLDTVIFVSGTGVSSLNATPAQNPLAFDTLTSCLSQTLSTWLVNTGCDSVKLSALFGLHAKGYQIIEPSTPVWIHLGDSVKITIAWKPLGTGDAEDSVTFDLTDGKGGEIFRTLGLHGFAVAGARHVALNISAIQLDSISGCAERDTLIVLKNLGTCDSIRIDSITIIGGSQLSLTGLPALPITLGSLDSLSLQLTMQLGKHELATGIVHIHGPDFDTSIIVHVSSNSNGGGSLTILSTQTQFRATSCQTDAKTFWIHNTGCAVIAVDSVSLEALQTSNSRFHFSPMPSLPMRIAPGDSTSISITFDGTAFGDSSANFVIGASGAGVWKKLLLQGSMVPTAATHLDLLTQALTKQASDVAGGIVTLLVRVNDAVDASLNLQTVAFTLSFNDNVLTSTSVTPQLGWSLASNTLTRGTMQLLFARTTATTLSANTPIANFGFRLTISDSLATNVLLSATHFNPTDPIYEKCTLAVGTTSDDLVHVSIDTRCGDSLIYEKLSGHSILDDISIHPNPLLSNSQGSRNAELQFTLSASATVNVDILDALGRSTGASHNYQLRAGSQIVPLKFNAIGQGSYFVRVTLGNITRVVKLSVEK